MKVILREFVKFISPKDKTNSKASSNYTGEDIPDMKQSDGQPLLFDRLARFIFTGLQA